MSLSSPQTSTPIKTERTGTKLAQVRALLAQPDGASLDELIAVTGWLPHTTRAALSRIKSSGQPLVRSARPDGRYAYRIEVVPEQPSRRTRKRKASRKTAPQTGAPVSASV